MSDPVQRAEHADRRFRPVSIQDGLVGRPAHPGTATVHSLLQHLRDKRLDTVPQPVGLVGDVETLLFIDGASGPDCWAHQQSLEAVTSPGPWNFVWRDHQAIALIDWDFLHPAPPVDDVAYALRWFTPMRVACE